MQTLIGTWRLVEGFAFDKSGERLPPPLGPQPMGVAEFGPDRLIAVVGDGSLSLPPGENRKLIAYSGVYSFNGNELVTRVDAASDPALLGTEQIRQIRFDGPRMVISPKNEVLASLPERLVFVWERAERV